MQIVVSNYQIAPHEQIKAWTFIEKLKKNSSGKDKTAWIIKRETGSMKERVKRCTIRKNKCLNKVVSLHELSSLTYILKLALKSIKFFF